MSGSGAELRVASQPAPGPRPEPVRPRGRPVERISLVALERRLSRLGVAGLEESLAEVTPERARHEFDSDPRVLETALLRTCQRVLLLVVTQGHDAAARFTGRWGPPGTWEIREDADVVYHLHRISSGLDSIASGEREIREQVRSAASNVMSRSPRPILRPLLLAAARSPPRTDGGETTSVADLAVQWLGPRLTGGPHRVLVVGSGTVGRKVAERVAEIAEVTVLYRHRPPDPQWTEQWHLSVLPSEAMVQALAEASAVVTAAKSTGRVLGMAELPADPYRGPRWFVDLGVPRNIDPRVGRRPGAELVDLDGLPRGRLPEHRLDAIRRAADASSSESAAQFAREAVEPWVTDLRRRGDEVRREELVRALAHAGELSEEARVAMERLSDRLVRRLLSGPTEELRALPPGPEADRLRRRVLEILREPDPGS